MRLINNNSKSNLFCSLIHLISLSALTHLWCWKLRYWIPWSHACRSAIRVWKYAVKFSGRGSLRKILRVVLQDVLLIKQHSDHHGHLKAWKLWNCFTSSLKHHDEPHLFNADLVLHVLYKSHMSLLDLHNRIKTILQEAAADWSHLNYNLIVQQQIH